MKPETRAYEIRIESDAERRGPGILKGTLMPYGERAADRAEVFEAGALHWDADGVLLREMHNRQAPIVRFTPEESEGRLGVEIPLPDTQRGRDAAVMVRNGTLRGLSVEFHAERETRRGGLRVIQRARLVGDGLVDTPSYVSATVEARAKGSGRPLWLEGKRLWL